jgi:hypothetical protein
MRLDFVRKMISAICLLHRFCSLFEALICSEQNLEFCRLGSL